ncbi:MAG TPA: hypothetical protein VGK06_15330 [Methanosarcina sp.]|jgi:hypothetical protein
MFELLASAPFVLNGTLIPTLPANAFMTTYGRLKEIAIICFIAGYAIRVISEKAAEKYRAKKEALPCSSN